MTDYEFKYLNGIWYRNRPIKNAARFLDRSVASVKKKAVRLGIYKSIDTFGVRTLAKFFNVDFRVVCHGFDLQILFASDVYKRQEKFDMPCEKKTYNGINHYDIDLEEFWKWAYGHRNIINWSKYDRGTLPLEPEWVLIEKNNYKPGKSRSRWTQQEIVMVRSLLRKGKSYKEIASEMGRTYNSICHLMKSGKVYS